MFPSVRKVVSAIFRSDEPAETSNLGQATASTSQASNAVNQSEDSEDVAQLLDELGAESPSKEGSDNPQQLDMDAEEGSQGFERVHHPEESPDVGQLLDELGADSQSQKSSVHAKVSGPPASERARPAERQAAVDTSDPPGQILPGIDNLDDIGLELEMCSEDARILAALPEWQPDYRPPASSGSLSSSADAAPQQGLGSGPTLEGGGPLCPSGADDAAPSRQQRTSASTQPEDSAALSQDQTQASQAQSDQRPASGEEGSSSQEGSQPSAAQSRQSGTDAPGQSCLREEEVITISDNTPSSQEKEGEESQSLLANDGVWLRKRVQGPNRPRKKNLQSPPARKKRSGGAPVPSAAAAAKEAAWEDEAVSGDRVGESSGERSDGRARRRVNRSPVPCTTARTLRRLEREERNCTSEDEASSPDPKAAQAAGTSASGQRLISSFLTRTVRLPPQRGQDEVPAQSGLPSRSPALEAQESDEHAPDNQMQCVSSWLSEERLSDSDLASEVFSAEDILNYAREIGISESSFFESGSSDSQEEDILNRAELTASLSTQPDENSAGADTAFDECNNRSVKFTAEEILDYMRKLDLAATPSLAGVWKGSPRKPRPELRGLIFTAADILEFQRQLDIPPTMLHTPTEVSPVVERRRPLRNICADNGSADFNLLTLQLPQGMRCQMLAYLEHALWDSPDDVELSDG